jgi:hypothetical protein
MSPNVSTLSMVNEAKDRFKEELLKKIAAVSSPTSTSTSTATVTPPSTPQDNQTRTKGSK